MPTEAERFWAKVEKTATCWLWTASGSPAGHGRFFASGRLVQAHRWAYENERGPIPLGLVLDHLCRVPRCVNPGHLDAVTDLENCRRGISPQSVNGRKTHCVNGHEFTPENTYEQPSRPGTRRCRACAKVPRPRPRYAASIPPPIEGDRRVEVQSGRWTGRTGVLLEEHPYPVVRLDPTWRGPSRDVRVLRVAPIAARPSSTRGGDDSE